MRSVSIRGVDLRCSSIIPSATRLCFPFKISKSKTAMLLKKRAQSRSINNAKQKSRECVRKLTGTRQVPDRIRIVKKEPCKSANE